MSMLSDPAGAFGFLHPGHHELLKTKAALRKEGRPQRGTEKEGKEET